MGDVYTVDESEPGGALASSWSPSSTPQVPSSTSLIAATYTELNEYHAINQKFSQMDPDEVLAMISSITARLAYLRSCLFEVGHQRANKLRTTNLDPLMVNLDLQFKIASRRISAKQFDYEMTRGAAT